MPRWNSPSQARIKKVTISIRTADKDLWSREATVQGMSLSRWIYVRARSSGVVVGGTSDPELAKQLGRLGVNLNQLLRLFHSHGISSEDAGKALELVHDIQRSLSRC